MAQTINRKLAQRHRFSTEDRRAVFIANINEALLQFDGEETFVEIETAGPQFERRSVETGLSDGINVEVVSGLTESDKIKDPNSAS